MLSAGGRNGKGAGRPVSSRSRSTSNWNNLQDTSRFGCPACSQPTKETVSCPVRALRGRTCGCRCPYAGSCGWWPATSGSSCGTLSRAAVTQANRGAENRLPRHVMAQRAMPPIQPSDNITTDMGTITTTDMGTITICRRTGNDSLPHAPSIWIARPLGTRVAARGRAATSGGGAHAARLVGYRFSVLLTTALRASACSRPGRSSGPSRSPPSRRRPSSSRTHP